MLFWLVSAGVLVLLLSIASLVSARRWREWSWGQRLLLLLTGPVDGLLVGLFLAWLGASDLTVAAGAVLFGTMSMLFVQPILVPQRLLVWRLAKENIRRRKRQSALMIAGLVIASSIITSSLVVGDSLDATVSLEVRAAWGETDVLIAGIDPMTGVAVAYDEALAERFWQSISADPALSQGLEGRQYGVYSTVSLAAENGLAEPSIPLFARNTTVDDQGVWAPLDASTGMRFSDIKAVNGQGDILHVVLNAAAADVLEVGQGDLLQLGAFVSDEGQRIRTSSSVQIHAVVPNEGQGAMAGTQSPAVFTDLESAQTLLGLEGSITRLSLAYAPNLDDGALRAALPGLEAMMNASLTAEDAGVVWTLDEATASLTVSSTAGLQRIAGEDVVALRENKSTLYPEAALLEVLQVPLIDVEHDDEALLTLADTDVTQLRLGAEAWWHVALTGIGFEPFDGGEPWLWQADEGQRLVDVAWSEDASAAVYLDDENIYLADVFLEDEEERVLYEPALPPVAVDGDADAWWVLSSDGSSLEMHEFDKNLSLQASQTVSVTLPSTVLTYDIRVDDDLYLRIEGLLNTQYYRSTDGTDFVEVNAAAWPSDSLSTPENIPDACDGVAALALDAERLLCTFEHGVLRWNIGEEEVESVRLPVLSDAVGFGRLPQMVLAFGGEEATLEVEQGQVLTSARLDALDLSNTSSLSMTGVLPYAYGNDTASVLFHGGTYTSVEGFDQLADLDAVVLGLVSLADAEVLALAESDDRSLLMFSGSGFGSENDSSILAIQTWFDQQSGLDDVHLRVQAVQLDASEQAEASSGALSAMFLVFGTFTMAAGVLLSLTIIMLLADVRRTELAAVRALGLRRSDARALFVYEGALLALVSGGFGSLLGLALAWVISVGFSTIFSSVGAQQFVFSWTLDSFLAGWIWGALLALLLLWSSAVFNAQLNIVRALRGARPMLKRGVPWGVFLLQVIAFGLIGLCTLGLLLFGLDGGLAYASYILLGVGLILLLTPLFTWQLPVLLNRNQPVNRWIRYAARNTLGAIGVLFLLWTLALAPIDPLRQKMEPNELAFIVLGLLQVFAGVLVLTSIAPQAVGWLAKRSWITRRTGPVGSVALAHPLAHPVRTAVVMCMFSITMFSVVVLAGYTEQFDSYSSDFVEEAEGEFELLLTSTRSRPIELSSDPLAWGIDHAAMSNIDAVGGVYRSPVHLEDAEGERMPYILRGVDDGFIQHGGLPLHAWDTSLGNTSDEAWNSISSFENIVFLDASFGLESTTDGTTLVPLQFSIGDSISLIDFSNPKNTREMTVGGFLKQSSYIFSPGVWMNGDVVVEQFGGEMTRMYVSVAPDALASVDHKRQDLPAQGKSTEVREAAAELEAVLDVELASKNVNVQTVAEEISIIQSLVLAILSLFEGYLALGLLVGVAGIGVVTVRNVSERRATIGMLRAVGFRQRHVLRLFSLEVSWVALLGMLNGLVIGYGFHVVLYKAVWEAEGAVFSFPWAGTLGLFLLGWLIVLITTFIPVRQASKIPPSAALRSA